MQHVLLLDGPGVMHASLDGQRRLCNNGPVKSGFIVDPPPDAWQRSSLCDHPSGKCAAFYEARGSGSLCIAIRLAIRSGVQLC